MRELAEEHPAPHLRDLGAWADLSPSAPPCRVERERAPSARALGARSWGLPSARATAPSTTVAVQSGARPVGQRQLSAQAEKEEPRPSFARHRRSPPATARGEEKAYTSAMTRARGTAPALLALRSAGLAEAEEMREGEPRGLAGAEALREGERAARAVTVAPRGLAEAARSLPSAATSSAASTPPPTEVRPPSAEGARPDSSVSPTQTTSTPIAANPRRPVRLGSVGRRRAIAVSRSTAPTVAEIVRPASLVPAATSPRVSLGPVAHGRAVAGPRLRLAVAVPAKSVSRPRSQESVAPASARTTATLAK